MNRKYGLYYAAAVYLLYLVYGLVADLKNGESDNPVVSIVAAVFFVAAAAVIALYARHKSKLEAEAQTEENQAEKKQETEVQDAGTPDDSVENRGTFSEDGQIHRSVPENKADGKNTAEGC